MLVQGIGELFFDGIPQYVPAVSEGYPRRFEHGWWHSSFLSRPVRREILAVLSAITQEPAATAVPLKIKHLLPQRVVRVDWEPLEREWTS